MPTPKELDIFRETVLERVVGLDTPGSSSDPMLSTATMTFSAECAGSRNSMKLHADPKPSHCPNHKTWRSAER
eukprot:963188-Amphidinium_carterae.1